METSLRLHKARYAHSVFCDEIRREINGKAIFIGVYDSDLYVPSLPFTLPTFSVLVTISSPVDMPLRRMIIRLYYGDNLLSEAPIPEAELDSLFGGVSEGQIEDTEVLSVLKVFRWAVVLNISPFTIEEEGNLRVRVETDSEILPGGALFIKVAPAASFHTP